MMTTEIKVVRPADLRPPDVILGVITPGMDVVRYIKYLEEYYGFP